MVECGGIRCNILTAIHKDYAYKKHNWKSHPADIGVDSGQCGIFSDVSYRNDDYSKTIEHGDGEDLGMNDEEGDLWYSKMCSRTLGEKCWGSYPEGVVSSSGYGDGSYQLSVLQDNGKIVGFKVDFGIEDDEDEEEEI